MENYQSNKIVHLNAEVTRACNLKCNYCFNDSGRKMNDELTLDEWKQAIDIAQEYGAKSALFTGGEVGARRDSPQIIEHSLNQGLKTSVLTNGLKIKDRYGDMIKDFDCVQVSLDSASAYSHDAQRGIGSWNVARQAIDYARGQEIPVEISSTISGERIGELEGMAGIAYLTGSKLLVRPLQAIGRATSIANRTFHSALVEKKKQLEELLGNIFVEDFAHYVPVLGAKHDTKMMQKGFVTILPNGIIRGTKQDFLAIR